MGVEVLELSGARNKVVLACKLVSACVNQLQTPCLFLHIPTAFATTSLAPSSILSTTRVGHDLYLYDVYDQMNMLFP